MKKFKSFLCIAMCLLLISGIVLPAGASGTADEFEISNPYGNIDFSQINTYKTALHSHTNATDGDQTLKENVEKHVQTGFDIVATTDHGTVNYSWETANDDKLVHGVLSLIGRSEGELVALGSSGVFSDGTAYTLTTENGDDYLVTDSGRKILRVPYGIEQNAVSVNAHVNSWFADYHDDGITTYIDAIKNVDALGGLCVINHPGEYSKARYEVYSADAYNTDEFSYWYIVNKWARLIDKYDACIGIDINSKGDFRTRFDRILWDELLERFSSDGKNCFAICSSDAHQEDKINTGFIYTLMPSLTSDALYKSIQNGEFFGASHCIGNPDELSEYADALKEFYGETELQKAVRSCADALMQKADAVASGKDSSKDLGTAYSVLDDEGCYYGTEPMITDIAVDDDENTISISTKDSLLVRWVSDGKTVAIMKADNAVMDLDDYADSIGNYVRAEVFGEGGVVYTQAFILNASENAGNGRIVDRGFVDIGIFDFLFGVLSNAGDSINRFFARIFAI